MSPARHYSYRPAALRGALDVALSETRLAADGWELVLADVTAAAFATQVVGDARFIRLDLWTGSGMRSLSYTANAKAWKTDPEARVFLELVRDTLRALAEITSDLDVTLGSRGGPRVAMFVIGLVSALAGGGLFIAALATGVSGQRLAGAAVPAALLVTLGALLGYGYSPWRKPTVARPGAVAAMIDGMIEKLADA